MNIKLRYIHQLLWKSPTIFFRYIIDLIHQKRWIIIMMKLLILTSILIYFPIITYGFTDFDSIYKKANNLYEKEDYNEALEIYQILIKSGIKNKDLYYNIANTYLLVDPIQLGEAILYYNKALEFDPSDYDIVNNLNLARSLVITDYPFPEDDENTILSKIINFLYINLTLNLLIWLFIILTTCLSLSFIIYFLSMKRNRFTLKLGIILLILMIIVFSLLLIRYRFDIMTDYGVIIEEEAIVYRMPSENQQTLFSLSEGVELEVIKKISEEWYYINLLGGIKGYIKSDKIMIH